MMRTSLCMAAFALLCSTSAIAQTSGTGSTMPGQTGSGQTAPEMGGSQTQQPTESGTMGSGSMGGTSGQSGTMGSETMGGTSGQSGTMGSGSMGGTSGQSGTMGGAAGQSAMEGTSGQSQNFAAFDQNQDGSLDRAEFARALQVQGSAPAAGGDAGTPSRQTMRGDRLISPLNETSVEFQRADTDGDGEISQEEFSSFSPQ